MGHAKSWKDPSTHITYNRGDKIVVTGTIHSSADGQSGTQGYYSNYTCYFYSYFTASWPVTKPIAIGNSPGSAWAWVEPSMIVSGGTKESFAITYNANGGSGAPGKQTKYWGEGIYLSNTIPTRTGHTFAGWSNTSTGSALWGAGGWYTGNGATTLYAVWIPNNLYIYQHRNGGIPTDKRFKIGKGDYIVRKDGPNEWWCLNYNYNSPGSDLYNASTFGLARKGYTHTGKWKDHYSGNLIDQDELLARTARDYRDGSTTAQKNGVEAVYYAQWTPNKYNVTYNANGGDSVNWGKSWSENATFDADYVIQKNFYNRPGYHFTGWKETDGSDWTGWIGKGWKYTRDYDTTLYAQWEINKYTVRYNLNGGTGSLPNQLKTHGKDLIIHNTIPTKEGHYFAGWYTIINGNRYEITDRYIYNSPGVIYADWALNEYTISYDGNGGTSSEWGDTWSEKAIHEKDYTIRWNWYTKRGHDFAEWNTEKNGSGERYLPGTKHKFTVPKKLFAIWEKQSYEVRFDADTNGGQGSIQKTYKFGQQLGTLPEAVKKYYKFTGWYTSPTGGEVVTSATIIEGPATLYAHYVADASVHIGTKEGTWKAGFPHGESAGKFVKGYLHEFKDGKWRRGIG